MSLLTPRAPTNALDVQAWAEFEREKERIYALRKIRKKRIAVATLVITSCILIVVSLRFLQREKVYTLPDDPAGAQMEWVLTVLHDDPSAVDQDDVAKQLAASLVEDGAEELVAAELARRAERWDTLRIVEYGNGASEFVLWAELESESMERGRVVITTEPAPPYGLLALSFEPSQR